MSNLYDSVSSNAKSQPNKPHSSLKQIAGSPCEATTSSIKIVNLVHIWDACLKKDEGKTSSSDPFRWYLIPKTSVQVTGFGFESCQELTVSQRAPWKQRRPRTSWVVWGKVLPTDPEERSSFLLCTAEATDGVLGSVPGFPVQDSQRYRRESSEGPPR